MKDVKLSPSLMASLAILPVGLAGGWLLNPAARHVSHETVAAADSVEPASPASESAMASAQASDARPANFAERLQRALAISRHLKRERAIAGLVDGLDARQIPEALAATVRLSGPTGDRIRAELLNRWGALDHESALKYALATGERYDMRSYPVLFGWAEADEAAVESWAANQEGLLQLTAWWALTEAVAEVDPEHALVLFAKIKSPLIEIFAKEIFGKWAQTAPAAAAARAEQLPHGFFRAEALTLVAGQWAKVDLPAALAWAGPLPDDESSIGTDVRAEGAPLVKVLGVWLDRDPGAAAAWLNQMPDKERQVEIWQSVISSMTSADPQRAAQLLPDLLPEDVKQKLLEHDAR